MRNPHRLMPDRCWPAAKPDVTVSAKVGGRQPRNVMRVGTRVMRRFDLLRVR